MAATNVHVVTARMHAAGEGLERALGAELAVLAQHATDFMRVRSAERSGGLKSAGIGTLTQSIKREKTGELEWSVGPSVSYAQALEDGVKPGGKGLPKWDDPDANNIKGWLEKSAFRGKATRARKNTKGRERQNKELRDRYEGLAWYIRHFGTQAHPFFAPTVKNMERIFSTRMAQAGREYLASNGAAGGTA